MKERYSKDWIPFWVDKWIFGSMRIECSIEERAIWIDLLCIAAKDEGYIRANEETPYLIQQLAGILVIEEKLLKNTIEKLIKIRKLKRLKNNTLMIAKWDKYQFSERHKRRFNNKEKEEHEEAFKEFWEAYPKKVAKDYAKEKFMILVRKGELENVRKAHNGYMDYLKARKIHDNFEQEPMNPATFLMKNRWKDYIDYKYKPKL